MRLGLKSRTQDSEAKGKDMREFPRVSSQCLVDFRRVAEDQQFETMRQQSQGLLQNISGGGVCVRMPEATETGELLALTIKLPQFPTAVISLGKVAWCRPAEDGFDAGIEFWWVGWEDPTAQEQIRDFITRSLNSK